ncbi:MAG: alpha/beta hydrolase [Natrialbaceae archaeon]|nr:alpha/beta hydrolase [Natrialbaceae archaeon]
MLDRDDVSIAFEERWPTHIEDPGTIVLVHGFASNRSNNWAVQGWYDALTDAGWHLVALDCRGHGESDKPTDPSAYAGSRMADDVLALVEHLELESPVLMGYSMGAAISLHLLSRQPERWAGVVLGGVGDAILEGLDTGERLARGLEVDDPSTIDDPTAALFRAFAESLDNDLSALAACARASQAGVDPGSLAAVTCPVLVVAGTSDPILGDPVALAEAIPTADLELIENADHLTTVPHDRFKDATRAFLEGIGSP